MIDNPFTMVVLIIGIVMFSVVQIVRYKTQARRVEHEERTALPEMGAELARLKERVAVLERIATDKNHLLEQEIESLRDRPLVSRRS